MQNFTFVQVLLNIFIKYCIYFNILHFIKYVEHFYSVFVF